MPEPSNETSSEATEWLTDLLYTGVGLGILAVNRIQVARRSAERELHERGIDPTAAPGFEAVTELLGDPDRVAAILDTLRCEFRDVDERLGGLENRVVAILGRIEPDLPDAARDLTAALRKLTSEHSAQLRALLGLDPP